MTDVYTLAAVDENLIPIVAIGGTAVAFVIWIVFSSVQRMTETSERERTKRELAAYVAEGSITPADAERIIASGETAEAKS